MPFKTTHTGGVLNTRIDRHIHTDGIYTRIHTAKFKGLCMRVRKRKSDIFLKGCNTEFDDYSVWAKKNNTLYLVSVGEIQYSEPFTKFRFTAIQRGSSCSYIDYENYDKLIRIDNEENFKLIKQNQHLVNNPSKVLCFNDKKIEFEYYSEKCNLCFNGKPSIIDYNMSCGQTDITKLLLFRY